MNRKEFNAFLTDRFIDIQKMNEAKGNDYAGSEDVFANFKRDADKLDLPTNKVWAVYFFKHLDAIETWLKDGAVKSEPIEGRILDAILYLFLLWGMIQEENSSSIKTTSMEVAPNYFDLLSIGILPDTANAMMEIQEKYGLGTTTGNGSNNQRYQVVTDDQLRVFELTDKGWKLV